MPQSRTDTETDSYRATAQSLKLHGGVPENKIKEQNIEGMKNGFENLDKHVENMKCFGQEVIVTSTGTHPIRTRKSHWSQNIAARSVLVSV